MLTYLSAVYGWLGDHPAFTTALVIAACIVVAYSALAAAVGRGVPGPADRSRLDQLDDPRHSYKRQ